jgi:hypothetical protein
MAKIDTAFTPLKLPLYTEVYLLDGAKLVKRQAQCY